MKFILKHSSDGFGTLKLNTRLVAGVKHEHILLDSKQFCFICITKIVHAEGTLPPPSPSLEWVERHLGVNLMNLLLENGNAHGISVHPSLLNVKKKTVNFRSTLCNDCASITSILSRPWEQSGEIGKELDVKTALNFLQAKIEESDNSGRWEEFYELLERRPTDIRMAALTSLGRILRREILKKCKAHLNDGQHQRHNVTLDQPATSSRSDDNFQQSTEQTRQPLAVNPHSRITSDSRTKKYSCIFCLLGPMKFSKLELHLRVHTNEKPFFCTRCDGSFKSRALCKYHTINHNPINQRPFQCHDCPLAFVNNTALKRHQSLHTEKRPFQCDSCPVAFKTNSNLVRHKNRKHTITPICKLCGKVFDNQIMLDDHLQTHKYSCEMCNKRFATKRYLDRHAKTHVANQDRPFRCDYCGLGLFSNGELQKHIQRHPNKAVRRFHCEICELRFGRKLHLQVHLQRHKTGKKLSKLN